MSMVKTLIWHEWRKIRWAAIGLLIVQMLLRILPVAGLLGQATSRAHAVTLLRTQLVNPDIADYIMLLGIVVISLLMMAATRKRNPYELSAALPIHPCREMKARVLAGGIVVIGVLLAVFAGGIILRAVYSPYLSGRVLWADMVRWLSIHVCSYMAILGLLLLMQTIASLYTATVIGLGLTVLPLVIPPVLGSYLYNRMGLDLAIRDALSWLRYPDVIQELGAVGFGMRGYSYHVMEKCFLYGGVAVAFHTLAIWLKAKVQREKIDRIFRFCWAEWAFRVVLTLLVGFCVHWLVITVMDLRGISWVHDLCLIAGLGIGYFAAGEIVRIGRSEKRRKRQWPVAAVLAALMIILSFIPQGWTPENQRKMDMEDWDTKGLSAYYPLSIDDAEGLQEVWDEMSVCLGQVEVRGDGSYVSLDIEVAQYLAEKSYGDPKDRYMDVNEFAAYWEAGQGPKQLAVLYAVTYYALVPDLEHQYVYVSINYPDNTRESIGIYYYAMEKILPGYREFAADPDLWKAQIEEKILKRKVDAVWDQTSHYSFQYEP